MVHRDHVGLVLTRTRHIKILRLSGKPHAEGEFSFLLSNTSRLEIVRIWEVKIAWDVILRTWHTKEDFLLLSLLLLHIANLLSQLSAVVNRASLATLRRQGEQSDSLTMSHMDWIVGTRA